MTALTRKKQKANAVFEGGGIKGIGIAGALSVASEYYDWMYTAGTSAGAIVASLVAAGYTAEEIRDLIFSIDYRRFEDNDMICKLPIFGPAWNLKVNLGLYKGDYIENWVREALRAKGVERFGDLVVVNRPGNFPGRYRLRVIASDITAGKMLVLPQDIAHYGIDPDKLEIAAAVRMSISIPFFFEPVVVTHKGDDGKEVDSYIVDGGLLSNFPVWLFDWDTGLKDMPTIGFKLIGANEERHNDINGPISMLKALFGTMLEGHDNRFVEEKNFQRTIAIPTFGIRTTDFDISEECIRSLYDSGAAAARDFFKDWNYRSYLLKYSD
ncbi:patatin-like phospholipase family protein [Phosphitispora sp. TUW77]|uniref:patatin-like phospholipase family protein n=1 Tax=Phosphitispora sp. TUW77 TaxID=3152361 RepID=UPI003AB22363